MLSLTWGIWTIFELNVDPVDFIQISKYFAQLIFITNGIPLTLGRYKFLTKGATDAP